MNIKNSIIEVNRILDRYSDNIVRMGWACDRIAWLDRYRKVPKTLIDALAIKATAIMDGTWYGDEAEEGIITKYILEV